MTLAALIVHFGYHWLTLLVPHDTHSANSSFWLSLVNLTGAHQWPSKTLRYIHRSRTNTKQNVSLCNDVSLYLVG